MKATMFNIFILLATQQASCQPTTLKINFFDCYTYLIDNKQINVCEVEIQNPSQEDFVMWFDKESVLGFDEKRKIHSYFFKIKGDFNLFNLLVEKNIKNEPPALFGTFLNKIGKGESFRIRIIGDVTSSDKSRLFIAEHLVAIKLSELKEQLKQPDSFFPWYERQSIDLLEKDLP
jgi:hypothetical protein